MSEIYPGWPFHPKGVIPEFEDVPRDQWPEVFQNPFHDEIEKLTIAWNNDGTQTAGTLARRICQLLNSKK